MEWKVHGATTTSHTQSFPEQACANKAMIHLQTDVVFFPKQDGPRWWQYKYKATSKKHK